ncbi:MAG TPA: hypothetical protein VKU87_03940, partial [Thermomicrobiaceae bacterium]|nr:hypothetical protein [Thermomicrobiaceae bacterium]
MTRVSRFKRGTILVAVLALLAAVTAGGLSTPARAASTPAAPGILPAKIFFPQTGHNLGGDFLTAWQANGGLMTYGYPLTEPFTQNGMTVQYFERARFEEHPDQAGTRYAVQATLLGNWAARDLRSTKPFQPIPGGSASKTTPDRIFFSQTGHYLAYGFKSYWESHGGLYVFGYPISEEFSQNGLTVQYFERAVFEYHPENKGTEYAVLLS